MRMDYAATVAFEEKVSGQVGLQKRLITTNTTVHLHN